MYTLRMHMFVQEGLHIFDFGDHCATSLSVQLCARLLGAPSRLLIGAFARQFCRCVRAPVYSSRFGVAPGRCACGQKLVN